MKPLWFPRDKQLNSCSNYLLVDQMLADYPGSVYSSSGQPVTPECDLNDTYLYHSCIRLSPLETDCNKELPAEGYWGMASSNIPTRK